MLFETKMKPFILVSLIIAVVIIAVVSQENLDERYPGFRTDNDPNNVVTKCTFWKGVETSVCHTSRFQVDNRSMIDFRPNYQMLNSYRKLFGDAQMQPEPCSDDLGNHNYWIKCPTSYDQELIDLDEDEGIYYWLPTSGCAANETMCRESCNLCGEENYITATKEVEKKTNLRCSKIMHHFPFSCMEKKVVETPLPSLFAIFLNEDGLQDVLNENNQAMCVTFNFRRRAGADCPLNALSEISVCTQKSKLHASFFASPSTNCQVPFDNWTTVNGEVRTKLDDENYRKFNVWRKAYFVFYNDPANGLGIDIDHIGTELQIVVYRNVDHIDIDEVTIFPGDCNDQTNSLADLDFNTGNTLADGVFLGIKNVD